MSRRTKQNGKLQKTKTLLDLIFALYQKKEQKFAVQKMCKSY